MKLVRLQKIVKIVKEVKLNDVDTRLNQQGILSSKDASKPSCSRACNKIIDKNIRSNKKNVIDNVDVIYCKI